MNFKNYIIFFAFCFSISFYAQTDSIKAVVLKPVMVKSSRIIEKEIKIPISISSINYEDTQAIRQQLSLHDYIKNIPGVFALNSNNFSQDLRVSIRGFGARSAFGIRGIKIIVDGIPETTPDGQGQIDNLNLGIIKNIEIIKGPASSLYGNASGGVISIYTTDSFDKNYINSGLTFGSYNFQQYQISAGYGNQKNSLIVQGTKSQTDGFRTQSGFKNYNLNLRMKHLFSENTKLNVFLNYSDSPYAGDAGGLTLEEVKEDRQQARGRNLDFMTGEQIDQFKIGISFNHKWSNSTFNNYGFYSSRNFYGLLPFEFGGIVNLNRDYFGFGSSYTLKNQGKKLQNSLQFGFDLASQKDDRSRFKNLNGQQGDNTLDQIESFKSIGIYALNHLSVGKFLIRTGIRFDHNNLKVEDLFLSNGDQSGDINLKALNPSLGISYQLQQQQYIYTNFSSSFETPVLSELSANPNNEGGFNASLKAQKAINYEIGYKLKTKNSRLEIVLFRIETSNDIIPFELEDFPGRTFFKNAGKTLRKGIEFNYKLKLSQNLNINAGYTLSKFNYTSFITPNGNFNDKQLPGIPKHMGSLAFNYTNKKGLNILLDNRYVGNLYANDSNSVKDNSYLITNLNFGYKLKSKHVNITPFLGINNLFNILYNDNIRINAFGNRYYEPAPGINIFGGIRIFHAL